MKDTKAILLEARSLQSTGKVKDACDLYRQLLTDGQCRPLISLPFAALLFKQYLHEEAYSILTTAISDNIATDDMVAYLLMMFIRDGRLSECQHWLNQYTSKLSSKRLLAFSWLHIAVLLTLKELDAAFALYCDAASRLSDNSLNKLQCLLHSAFYNSPVKVTHPQQSGVLAEIHKQGLWVDSQSDKTLIIPPTATFTQALFNINAWFSASQCVPVNCLFLLDYSLISGHSGFHGFSTSPKELVAELSSFLEARGSKSHAILGVSGGALVGSNLAKLSDARGILSFSGLTHTQVQEVDGSFSSLLANIKSKGQPEYINYSEYGMPDDFVWHHHFGELAATDRFSADYLKKHAKQAELFAYPTSAHPVSGWLNEQGCIEQVFRTFYQQIGWEN